MTSTPRHVEIDRRLKGKRRRKLVNRLLKEGYSLRMAPKVERARFDRRGE